jgi:hypothetical protein
MGAGELRSLVLHAIRAAARERAGDEPERRRDLLTRLDRLQDVDVDVETDEPQSGRRLARR